MADAQHGRRHLHGGSGEQLGRRCRRTAVVHARAHRTSPGLQRREQFRRDAVVDERSRVLGPGGVRQVYQTGTVRVHKTGDRRVHQTRGGRVHGRRATPKRITGQNQS